MKDPFEREVTVFGNARRLPAAERAAYLDEACRGDTGLRQRVEELLQAGEEAEGFLQEPAPGAHRPEGAISASTLGVSLAGPGEKAGDRIGRYKLLQQIGEGGCGVVYMAEQEEPVRRRVALKIIKLGMDTRQVIARFEAERQALAMMDHSNIAKVLDAGTTEAGRPYFVMELVRGIKITEYCDEHNLSTKDRLGLFMQVCHAVQHAHQKGIIHRDLKPSNILVASDDGTPVPKVIDFGIAKATQGRLTDQTLFTAFEQFIGTPAYMSPEQAELTMQDVDTRTDIYSLGVLLYELLTGKTPFDAQELLASGLDTMRRTIREQEPERPSTKLSTMLVAADVSRRKPSTGLAVPSEAEISADSRQRLRLKEQIKLVRGDLDWIVMKCLEKERGRRYETANGLASDVKRHLNCEPVVARPPSRWYEFQKTVRRHKFGFTAGGALIFVLAFGVVVSALEAIRATRAEREQVRLRKVAEVKEQTALANEGQARQAEQREAAQRLRAETQELAARRQAYISDVNLAAQAIRQKNLGYALELLDRHRPLPGYPDLRGWEWRHLWHMTRSDELCTLDSNAGFVTLIAVSPDGSRAAVAGQDTTMKLWDLTHRREILRVKYGNWFGAFSFSGDGGLLALADRNTLRFYDPISAREISQPLSFAEEVNSVAFSRDGTKLAVACGGGLHLLDPATHDEVWRAEIPRSWRITFSPDSRRLAIATWERSVVLLDTVTRARLAEWPGPTFIQAGTLEFSPDSKLLAAACLGHGEALIWDLTTLQLTKRLPASVGWIGALVFSSDGRQAAVTASDQSITLYDCSTWRVTRRLKGHADEAWMAAFSPDGKTLISGSKDETVRLWDVTPGAGTSDSLELPAGTDGAVLSPDGKTLLTLTTNQEFTVWDCATLRSIATRHLPAADFHWCDPLRSIAISSDRRVLTMGGHDGVVRSWEMQTLQELGRYEGLTQEVTTVAFSPGGEILAAASSDGTGSSDGTVKLWDVTSHRVLATCNSRLSDCPPLSFSPGNKLFAFGNLSCQAEVWELAHQNRLFSLIGHKMSVEDLVFSPDGQTLVTAGVDGRLKLWETSSATLRKTLRGSLTDWSAVAISPDGRRLFAGGDGIIKVWEMDSMQEVAMLEQGASYVSQSYVSALRFLPDGHTLVSASPSSLHLWRAPPLEEIDAGNKGAPATDRER